MENVFKDPSENDFTDEHKATSRIKRLNYFYRIFKFLYNKDDLDTFDKDDNCYFANLTYKTR